MDFVHAADKCSLFSWAASFDDVTNQCAVRRALHRDVHLRIKYCVGAHSLTVMQGCLSIISTINTAIKTQCNQVFSFWWDVCGALRFV